MKSLLTTKLVIAFGVMFTLASILLLNHGSTSERAQAQLQRHQHDMLINALVEVQQFAATLDLADPSRMQSGLNSLAHLQGIDSVWITDSNFQIVYSSVSSNDAQLLETLNADVNLQPLYTAAPVILEQPAVRTGIQIGAVTACHGGNDLSLGPFACDFAFVSSDMGEAFSSLRTDLFIQLLFSLLAALCVSVFVYHLSGQGFLDPISKLTHVIHKFSNGQQDARAGMRGIPEVKFLNRRINKLFNNIEDRERRLTQKKQLYESLIDTMADGLITVQADGTIGSMNRAAEKLLGFRPKELVGSNISLIFADESAQDPEEFLNGFILANRDGNAPTHWEVEMRSRAGKLVPIRLSISKMVLDGDALFIGVLSDMSDIKEMQAKLLALNERLSKSNAKLEQTVITDSLTGLFNRRHFDDTLKKELARSTRQQSSLSLMVVDIDFFKQYNDRYGHARGDDCLRQVSQCMLNFFKRSGDLPARYGGEEFAIILPNCDALELQERAETLRAAIADLAIPHADARDLDVVTVSIGAVTFKPENAEVVSPKPKELFSQADKALYSAKGRGRNTVVFAGLFQPMPLAPATGQLYGHFLTR